MGFPYTQEQLEAEFEDEPTEMVFGHVRVVRHRLLLCGPQSGVQLGMMYINVLSDFFPYLVQTGIGRAVKEDGSWTFEDLVKLFKDRDEIAGFAMQAIQREAQRVFRDGGDPVPLPVDTSEEAGPLRKE